ncbi:hypothetical protein OSI08_22355 [Mycobacterium ulcerans]
MAGIGSAVSTASRAAARAWAVG